MTPIRLPSQDRQSIADLITEFCFCVDHAEGARLHELFTPDGVIETPHFKANGQDEIRERFTARSLDTSRKTRHWWSNLRVNNTDGDEVSTVSNSMTIMVLNTTKTMIVGGSSHDVFVRSGEGWLFRSRRLEVVHDGELVEMTR